MIATALALAHQAWAASIAYTTIPNSSGAVTCSGVNPDSSSCTWTVEGSIAYSSFSGVHGSEGYGQIVPEQNSNTPSYMAPQNCVLELAGSNNIASGGISVETKAYLAYGQYGQGYLIDTLSTGSAPLAAGGHPVMAFGFSTLNDVKEVQYKVASRQSTTPASGWSTAATPYL